MFNSILEIYYKVGFHKVYNFIFRP